MVGAMAAVETAVVEEGPIQAGMGAGLVAKAVAETVVVSHTGR